MKVLFACSEAVPFAKTGGLGDVCGTLPAELARLGHEPMLILPAYRQVHQAGQPIEPLGVEFELPVGGRMVRGSLLRSRLPGTSVPVFLVRQDHYFDRAELYQVDGRDYPDNCERFVFFARAVLETVRLLGLRPDVLHLHDWQTGLIAAYQKIEPANPGVRERTAVLMTIHNMAFQGVFWHWDMLLTGLDWKYFNWRQMEFFGKLNFLKTGLVFSDAINTVSPRYAQEIQTAPLGCGLEGLLTFRRDDLSGIINGVDYSVWNPATDEHLAQRYDAATFPAGKAACKAALQRELGLPVAASVPLIGFVGRLTDQKGLDLIEPVLSEWLKNEDAQWVILGTGDARYHELLRRLAERYPQRCAAALAFSDPLAHRIEAGADLFVMPSKFEPCGLNQLYSLKYGTVPVVRATGGLYDTVVNVNEATLGAGTATGFSFLEYNSLALEQALRRACRMYRQRDTWQQLVRTGMGQDWSWTKSAQEYVRLYERIVTRVRQEANPG